MCTTLWMDRLKRRHICKVSHHDIVSLSYATNDAFGLWTGEYKTILQLVGVLSHGKLAKRLTDHAIDLMQDVQNLRKAIYEYAKQLWL